MKEIIKVVSTCLAVAAAFAGFGYYLGRDTASSEVSQLEREIDLLKTSASTFTVLSYLEDLKEYNENLFEFSYHEAQMAKKDAEIKRLSLALENTSNELQQKFDDALLLEAKLELARREKSALLERLDVKYRVDDEFWLGEGQSKSILGGAVIVGVKTVYSSFASVVVDNSVRSLDIGERVSLASEDVNCSLVVKNIDKANKITAFDVVCRFVDTDAN